MKKQYFLVIDVETANFCEDVLCYDVSFAIADRKGNIYHSESFVVSDIFFRETELMQSAYYAQKIPQYFEGIKNKAFRVVNFYTARKRILETMREWNVTAVCAYNASFDYNALNRTERWLSKSKYRYFFPYGTKVYDIWHMACQVIYTQKGYNKFCLDNNFVSAKGNILTNAQTVYAYMTKDADFAEAHTGLEDVFIEAQIMAHCFRQHKKMDKKINRACWRIPQPTKRKKAKISDAIAEIEKANA